MIMITGGAFQGKTEYARQRFFLTDSEILDCGSCDMTEINSARCVSHYELAVRRMLESGIDPLAFTRELNCGIVLVNEIGSGIIPLEKSERQWRELTGRAGCILAERAEEVIRVCCGIAARIK